jgi:hypothetical protein
MVIIADVFSAMLVESAEDGIALSLSHSAARLR